MIPSAPTPVGPFSHAAEADGWVFLTGQMPTSPTDDAAPLPEGVVAQTRRVMDNLVRVTTHLRRKLAVADVKDLTRRALTVVPTLTAAVAVLLLHRRPRIATITVVLIVLATLANAVIAANLYHVHLGPLNSP